MKPITAKELTLSTDEIHTELWQHLVGRTGNEIEIVDVERTEDEDFIGEVIYEVEARVGGAERTFLIGAEAGEARWVRSLDGKYVVSVDWTVEEV